MKLNHGLHLAYCTNIHRGEDWAQTMDSIQRFTREVKLRVCPQSPYAIGLRRSAQAARELADPQTLTTFRHWLDAEGCYVFTINGFPFGRFHGGRVKEQVYAPDWTTRERLDYTNLLFDLLAQLVPAGIEGSVSTLPGSFKEFIHSEEQHTEIRRNLWHCLDHITRLSERTGRTLHLGLEPEPLGLFETTQETVAFFDRLTAERPGDQRLLHHIGVNYDTCHLAVEYEHPREAVLRLQRHGIRISKFHLSSALKVSPTPEVRRALASFADDVYLHQVIARTGSALTRYRDLDVALANAPADDEEWRIHFHIPLHCPPTALFDNTSDHLLGVLELLRQDPTLCSHLEMETYTWEVMPAEMKGRSVVEQLVGEYDWCLARCREHGLTQS